MGMLKRNEGELQYGDRPFAVRSERTEAGERIQVLGEMDMSVTGELDREMRRAEAGDASRIVLDLGRLDFVDAAGVRLLLDLKARSDENGGRLRMTRASSPHVRRVLEVTGAGAVLPFVD
jgi:anti-sigma B factor antagonist